MEYYIREILSEDIVNYQKKNAGGKARTDINDILTEIGVEPIDFEYNEDERKAASLLKRLTWHRSILKKWDKQLSGLRAGDYLYIQFPITEHSIFQSNFYKKLTQKGIKVILIVHDLTTLRESNKEQTSKAKKLRYRIEEINMIKVCSKVIVHNEKMKDYLVHHFSIDESRIISLDIFDYIINDWDEQRAEKRDIELGKPVIISGNMLRYKSGYVYDLPDNQEFNLYGMNYEGQEASHIHYFGALLPEDLVYEMTGSFGLVWDGEKASTCSGIYGNYLKINNPHKTSLYIASEIPVIIWKEAALAGFVVENGLGIAVDSIQDIPAIAEKMSQQEYNGMKSNLKIFAEKLRNGYYTKLAVKKCHE